jgi:hypothetical protein
LFLHSAHLLVFQLEAAATTIKQFDAVRKTLEEKCAIVPKLKTEIQDLKQKLKESLMIVTEVAKAEQMIQSLASDRDILRAEAVSAQRLKIEVSDMKQQLQASTDALHRMSDEVAAIKLQAALKLKAERVGISSAEAAMDLLQDVSMWRKKCVKAESELHELKVTIAADARRSFLALALTPRARPVTDSRGIQ